MVTFVPHCAVSKATEKEIWLKVNSHMVQLVFQKKHSSYESKAVITQTERDCNECDEVGNGRQYIWERRN